MSDMGGMGINFIDIVALLMMAIGCGIGISMGLVGMIAGFASMFFGVLLSVVGGPFACTALGNWVQNPMLLKALAYTVCFMLGALGVRLVATLLSWMLEKFMLAKANRAAGGLIGAGTGALLFCICCAGVAEFGKQTHPAGTDTSVAWKVAMDANYNVKQWASDKDVASYARRFVAWVASLGGNEYEKAVESAANAASEKINNALPKQEAKSESKAESKPVAKATTKAKPKAEPKQQPNAAASSAESNPTTTIGDWQ